MKKSSYDFDSIKFNSIDLPYSTIFKSMTRATEQLQKSVEIFAQHNHIISEAQIKHAVLASSVCANIDFEKMNSLYQSSVKFASLIAKIDIALPKIYFTAIDSHSIARNMASIQVAMEKLANIAKNIDFSLLDLQTSEDSSIDELENQQIQIQEKVKDYLELSQLSEPLTLDDFNRGIGELKKHFELQIQKSNFHECIKNLIIAILVQALFLVIPQIVQVDNLKITSKMIKDVKIICQSAQMDSTNMRIAIRHLDVRVHPNLSSMVIGKISFGYPVEVVFKNRNWCRVRLYEDGTIIEGWVLTRYIKKIEK